MKPEKAFQMPKLRTGRKRTKDEEEYVDEVHPELLRAMREENCNEFLRIAEKYGRKNELDTDIHR